MARLPWPCRSTERVRGLPSRIWQLCSFLNKWVRFLFVCSASTQPMGEAWKQINIKRYGDTSDSLCSKRTFFRNKDKLLWTKHGPKVHNNFPQLQFHWPHPVAQRHLQFSQYFPCGWVDWCFYWTSLPFPFQLPVAGTLWSPHLEKNIQELFENI